LGKIGDKLVPVPVYVCEKCGILKAGSKTVTITGDYIDLPPLTTLPAGVEGRMCYDANAKKIKVYNGSVWKEVPTAPSVLNSYRQGDVKFGGGSDTVSVNMHKIATFKGGTEYTLASLSATFSGSINIVFMTGYVLGISSFADYTIYLRFYRGGTKLREVSFVPYDRSAYIGAIHIDIVGPGSYSYYVKFLGNWSSSLGKYVAPFGRIGYVEIG